MSYTRGGASYFEVPIEGEENDASQSTPGDSQSLGSRRMARSGSFGKLRNSLNWLGEQAQTQFLDLNLEAHANNNNSNGGIASDGNSPLWQKIKDGSSDQSLPSIPKMIRPSSNLSQYKFGSINTYNSYNSVDQLSSIDKCKTIRFQVIVWSISSPDVKNNTVSMKFRVTLFWEDEEPKDKELKDAFALFDTDGSGTISKSEIKQLMKKMGKVLSESELDAMMTEADTDGNKEIDFNEFKSIMEGGKHKRKKKTKAQSMWVMAGRRAAYKRKITEASTDMIDVPPISILNADSFEVIGQPEVQLLQEDKHLMRWSCMYRAQLTQDDMKVHEFPHDKHNLTLKLGILSQRQRGGRWDSRKYKLALANESDTKGSIRIPYGMVVDNMKIPGFETDSFSGLDFSLSELQHGSMSALKSQGRDKDFYLKVKLRVMRESGYYDKNIMPLLSMLNLVSISILTLDGDHYFQRGLMSLNIAFVEIGLRMQLDNHLPSVGYQIKMQRILNFYFYSILSIVLESSLIKFLIENGDVSVAFTRNVDFIWATLLLANQAYLSLVYADLNHFNQSDGLSLGSG